MLAVHSAMDSLPRSSSFNPINGNLNLIRHPSAEDLDAAHQLVSSARGEHGRPRPETEANAPGSELYHSQPSPAAATDSISESAEGQSPPTSMTMTDTTDNVAGQVCR